MVSKGKEQVKSLEIDDTSQLSLEPEVSPAAPRAKRQARQAEDEQAKDPYLDSGKELDDILLKFKKYAKYQRVRLKIKFLAVLMVVFSQKMRELMLIHFHVQVLQTK